MAQRDKTVVGGSVALFQWEVVPECHRPLEHVELEEKGKLRLGTKAAANMFFPMGLSTP